jgi:outer membrane biosynthesis protein TonB
MKSEPPASSDQREPGWFSNSGAAASRPCLLMIMASAHFAETRLLLALALSVTAHASLPWLVQLGGTTGAPPAASTETLQAHLATTLPAEVKTAASAQTEYPRPETIPAKTASPAPVTEQATAEEDKAPAQALPFPGNIIPKHYFTSRELDQRPRPLTQVTPQFPDGTNSVEVVVLRLLIAETGELDDIQILTSGIDARLANNAIRAFRAARFAPGIHQGHPVPSAMLIEIIYDPNDLSANWEKANN